VTFPVSRAIRATLTATAATILLAGCTVKKTEAPPLSGPSELGTSLQLKASPDQVAQDGLSQSQIEIIARGPDSRPLSGLSMRVEMYVAGQLADYGRLSTRSVTTGSDGIARLTYTAPPPLPEPVDYYTVVSLRVTPVGTEFANANARYVDIRLTPPGNGPILPPNSPPIGLFTISPTPVKTYSPVTFDASQSKDEGVVCGSNCRYAWDFGDGSSGTGMVATHEYRQAATYNVRLTVTDIRGGSSTVSQSVTVTAVDPPKAEFIFSPAEPRFGQEVFFNASASTAASGFTIVSYEWDFGTGRGGSGRTVAKRYDVDLIPPGALPGDEVPFNVTLSVADNTFSPTGVGVTTKVLTVRVP
jgi:PKD repeat protein